MTKKSYSKRKHLYIFIIVFVFLSTISISIYIFGNSYSQTTQSRAEMQNPEESDTKTNPIIGGNNVTNKDVFPFFATLYYKKRSSIPDLNINNNADYDISEGFFCGGTVIAPRWILTAGHCVYFIDKDHFKDVGIAVGLINKKGYVSNIEEQNNTFYNIKNVYSHHDYIYSDNVPDNVLINDIGLIEVDGYIPIQKQVSVPEVSYSVYQPDETVTVIGFGCTKVEKTPIERIPLARISNFLTPTIFPTVLPTDEYKRSNNNNLVSSYNLKQINLPINRINDETNTIYIGYNTEEGLEKNTCKGDSGGPALYEANGKIYVLGIVSAGDTMHAAYFTKTDKYAKWIDRVESGSMKCQDISYSGCKRAKNYDLDCEPCYNRKACYNADSPELDKCTFDPNCHLSPSLVVHNNICIDVVNRCSNGEIIPDLSCQSEYKSKFRRIPTPFPTEDRSSEKREFQGISPRCDNLCIYSTSDSSGNKKCYTGFCKDSSGDCGYDINCGLDAECVGNKSEDEMEVACPETPGEITITPEL